MNRQLWVSNMTWLLRETMMLIMLKSNGYGIISWRLSLHYRKSLPFHTQSHMAQDQREYLSTRPYPATGHVHRGTVWSWMPPIHKGGQIRYDDTLCIAIDNRVSKGSSSNLPCVKGKHRKCNQPASRTRKFIASQSNAFARRDHVSILVLPNSNSFVGHLYCS